MRYPLMELFHLSAATAKSLQSCPTLCDPVDGSPPGSPVPGILQARTLEWVAISFYNAWKWKVKGKSLSCVWLFATPWTAAYQAPPSMGLSRQEYWSGVPSPSPTPPLKYPYCQWTHNWLLLSIFQSASCKVWAGKRQLIYQKNAKIFPYMLQMPEEQMWECSLRVLDQGGLNAALSSV